MKGYAAFTFPVNAAKVFCMMDRLTQLNLLPPVKKPPAHRRFFRAVATLPQYRGLKRALRFVFRPLFAALRLGFLHLWVRLVPLLHRLWLWFLHTPPVQSVLDWAHRFAKAVRALPQFRFLVRMHRYFNAYPVTRFFFYLFLIAIIELPLCLGHTDPAHDSNLYLVVDEMGPEVIRDHPDEDRELPLLTISSDSAPSDTQLILHKGDSVLIRHGEERLTVTCRRETVANLLRRLHIEVAPDEMVAVNVSGSSPLIHISDELRYERNVQTFSAYHTRTYSNYLLEKGIYQVIQEGKPGCITDTYEDVYRSGKLVESHLIARSDDSAVTQIVEYGHLVHTIAQDMRAVREHPFHDGSGGGYLVFENDDSMLYREKVINNSTAYYGGPITATGHPVGTGVIAVDPTVYPYHTSMYIGSVSGGSYYGIGTAYDCGGAVKGRIIDLWFPTYWDCVPWGRRDVTCYILQDTNVT